MVFAMSREVDASCTICCQPHENPRISLISSLPDLSKCVETAVVLAMSREVDAFCPICCQTQENPRASLISSLPGLPKQVENAGLFAMSREVDASYPIFYQKQENPRIDPSPESFMGELIHSQNPSYSLVKRPMAHPWRTHGAPATPP